MKKIYIRVGIIISLLLSALLVFYIAVYTKTEQINQKIKKIDTFTLSGGDNSAVMGETPFNNKSATDNGINDTGAGNGNSYDEQKASPDNKDGIYEIYNLAVAGVGFSSGKIIFTDRAEGYSFSKDNPLDKNKRLDQNAEAMVYDAEYSDNYILRKTFTDTFEAKYDIEKINSKDTVLSLDGNLKSCHLFTGDILLCLKPTGSTTEVIMFDLKDENIKEQVLFASNLSHWQTDYKNGNLYLLQSPSAYKESVFIKKEQKGGESVLEKGIGLDAKVSDDESYVLVSKYEDAKLTLYLDDIKNDTKTKLDLATLARKCVFTNKDIVCAVPKELPKDYVLLDDWLKGKFNYADEFYKINLKDLQAKKLDFISRPNTEIDAYKLRSSQNANMLSFVNKRDGKGWVIILAQAEKTESDVGAQELSSSTASSSEEIKIKLKRDEI